MSFPEIELTCTWFYSFQKDFPVYNKDKKEVEMKVISLALSIFIRAAIIIPAASHLYDSIRGVPMSPFSPLMHIKSIALLLVILPLHLKIFNLRSKWEWFSKRPTTDLLKANHPDKAIIDQIKQNPLVYGAVQHPETILAAIEAKQYRPGLIDWVTAGQKDHLNSWVSNYFAKLALSAHEEWALQTATKLKEKGLKVQPGAKITQPPIKDPDPLQKLTLATEPPRIWSALTFSWSKNTQTTTEFAQVLLEMECQPEETTFTPPLHSLAVFAHIPQAFIILQTLIDSGLEVSLFNSSKLSLWDSFEASWETNAVQTRKFIQLLLDHGFRHNDKEKISRRFRNEPIGKALLAGRLKNPDSPFYKDRFPLDMLKLIFDWSKQSPPKDPPAPLSKGENMFTMFFSGRKELRKRPLSVSKKTSKMSVSDREEFFKMFFSKRTSDALRRGNGQ